MAGLPSNSDILEQFSGEEIDVDDDNDSGGDELEIGAPVTREEKKRNRFREVVEKADQAEQRAQRLEQELAQVKNYVVQLPQHLQQQQFQQQQQQQADPLELSLHSLRDQRRTLEMEYEREVERYTRNRQQMPRAEYEKFVERAEKLDEERVALIAERRVASRQPDPNQQALEAHRRILAAENSDVYGNERALYWARGRFAQYEAAGHPNTRELHDKVMEEAREAFGMQRKKARYEPEDEERRSKYVGVGNGAGGAASGKARFVMTAEHKEMADLTYAHIKDPKERYQKYANTVGKQFVSKK